MKKAFYLFMLFSEGTLDDDPFLLRTLSYEYISSEDCHTMFRVCFFFNQKQNDLFNSNQWNEHSIVALKSTFHFRKKFT